MKTFAPIIALLLCALEFTSSQDITTEATEATATPAFTMDPPSTYEFKFNRDNNHLNIPFDKTKRSNNYFLTIGDWGRAAGAYRGCQDMVGKSMQDYVANMTE
jgi:hypothetical protein